MAWRWVCTGVYPAWSLRVQVWTRFEKNDVSRVEYDLIHPRSAMVWLPDRTLFMTNPTEPWDIRPDGRWDQVWDGDPYRGEWGESWLPFVMMSAYNGMNTQSHNGSSFGCRTRHWITNNVKFIGDSGGSQLKSGTTDFVDPEAALVWMNQVCDIGAPLDVAPHIQDRYEPNIFKPLIRLQKRHNRMWLRNRRKDQPGWQGLQLKNPAHGFTVDQVRRWCAETADERFIGWAVGGDNPYTLFQHIRTLLVCLLEFNHPNYTHHHMYGAANRTKMPAMAWLGKYFPLITGDGTGWLDGIKYKRMMLPHLNGHAYAEHFGHKARLAKTAMPLAMSPCSCPACQVIGGHYEVYNLPRATPGPNLLMLHEAYVSARSNMMWSELAESTNNIEEYVQWIIQAYTMAGEKRRTKSKIVDYTVSLVRFVDYAMQHGIDRADQKFKRFMMDDLGTGSMKALFQRGAAVSKIETFGGSSIQDGVRTSILPNYLTRKQLKRMGVRTNDLQPGRAEGAATKGHARGVAQTKGDKVERMRI